MRTFAPLALYRAVRARAGGLATKISLRLAAALLWVPVSFMLAPSAHAVWQDLATISSTLGTNAGRLCVGAAGTNIGCPTAAPLLDASGGLLTVPTDLRVVGNLYVSGSQSFDGVTFANGGISATGIISATAFSGDGSALTNLNTAGFDDDRIVSGTTNVTAAQNGSVTISTNGVERFVIGNSGRVGIGTATPTENLHVSGTSRFQSSISIGGNPAANATQGIIFPNGLKIEDQGGSLGLRFGSHSVLDTAIMTLRRSTDTAPTANVFAITNRALTNNLFSISPYGAVRIGEGTPSTSLDISGTLRIANGGEACDANRTGAIRYNSGVFEFCAGTQWQSLADVANAGGIDTLVSGTTRITTNQTGTISLTTGGVNTGYFDTAGRLIVPGISITSANGLSTTELRTTNGRVDNDLYVGGNLFVSGSQSIDGVTFANGGVSATGMITATAFSGDGSALTNLNTAGFDDDRIVSGTTNVTAAQDGSITLSTAGSTRMTVGQNGNIGIGNSTPSASLHITGDLRANSFSNNGIGSVEISNGNNKSRLVLRRATSADSWGIGLYFSNDSLLFTYGVYGDPDNLGRYMGAWKRTGELGVATVNPSTSLHVSGTLRIANGGEACDANRTGAIRYNAGVFEFCAGTQWQSLADVANAGGIDTLVSGTTKVTANQTGYISLTTGGATTGYFDTAGRLVVPGISITSANGLSTTELRTTNGRVDNDLYVGGNLFVSGSQSIDGVTFANGGVSATGMITATAFSGDGSALTNLNTAGFDDDRIVSGTTNVTAAQNGSVTISTAGTERIVIGQNGYLGISTTAPTAPLEIHAANGNSINAIFRNGPSSQSISINNGAGIRGSSNLYLDTATTGDIFLRPGLTTRMTLKNNGRVGIGTGEPSTSLHVAGTIRIANGGEACDADRTGAIRYTGGDFEFCRNGTTWQTLASVADSAAPDRIVSGTTTFVVTSNTGFISLTQGGTNTGWFSPQTGLVTLGVSATGPISATRGYFNGNLTVRGLIDLVTGTNVVAVGQNAWSSNSGSNVNVLGVQAGQNNTGNNVTAMGHGVAQNNTGSDLTALGYFSARGNTGSNVTAIGRASGYANTGNNLAALGYEAANYNSGINVVALGYRAARYNSGTGVIAIGVNAGYSNTADYVTAVGNNAAQNNTVKYVTALGHSTAAYNTGTHLTAVGSNAALNNTGSFVTTLGYQAGISNTFSNVTLLGNGVYTASKDSQVILGNSSVVEVATSGTVVAAGLLTTGSAGIGVSTPSTSLHTSGTLRLANGGESCDTNRTGAIRYTSGDFEFCRDGTTWEPLASIADSAAPDRIVSGTTTLVVVSNTGFISLTQGATNTGWFDPQTGLVTLGVSATGPISATNGYFNGNLTVRGLIDLVTGTVVGVGSSAATYNTGANLTAFGSSTGQYNSGSTVTAMGPSAAQYNSGASLVAMGFYAGRSNTGNYVTTIGSSAGSNNTGSNLTAVGFGAAQSNIGGAVVAMGYAAAQYNSGTNVVAIGQNAANSNAGGNSAVVGHEVAQYNTGGSLAVLGYRAARSNTGTDVAAIGANAAGSNAGTGVAAIGTSAAQNNTGNYVTALGYVAASNNTGGSVAAVGYGAARYNSGTNVVAIGVDAAQNNTGANLTALGYAAGVSNTFSNVTLLGNGVYTASKANQVILGNSSVVEVATSGTVVAAGLLTTGSAGIGVSTPSTSLHTSGTLRIASGGESCDTNRTGAIRYTSGDFEFCRDGTTWQTLANVADSAAPDRIVSGTTTLVVTSATGYISLTQGGTNTGWFDPARGLVTLGVSATGPISATNGYFNGNVGIGITSASYSLDVGGYARIGRNSTNSSLRIANNNTSTGISSIQFENVAGTAIGLLRSFNSSYSSTLAGVTLGGAMNLLSNGPTLLYANNQPIYLATSNTSPTMTLATSGYVGIGTVDPSTSLHVSGTIRIANGGEACDANRTGAIRYTNGDFEFCRDGVAWQSLATIADSAAPDRIVSGTTTLVVTSATGYISLTQGGTNTGWFSPQTGLVTLGVSTTGPISGTNGYFNGNLTVRGVIDIVTGTGNVVVGQSAAQNSTGDYLTAIGSSAAYASSGTNVTGLGYYAAYQNTGDNVTGVGYYAAYQSPGANVTSIGVHAARQNTGADVTGMGYFAAYLNTGNNVTGVGGYAARQNTGANVTGLGYTAARQNTGTNVTGVGYAAAYANTGANVTGVGYYAARQNTAANVVAIGYEAGYNNAVANQFILKQNNINSMPLMQGDFATGNLGIGTTSPTARLHVSGTLRLANGGEACDADRTGAIRYTGGDFEFCRDGVTWQTLASVADSAAPDRIVSGTTTLVVTSATGYISLTQGGTNTGWFSPQTGLVTLGVSTTGPISGTGGYFSGTVKSTAAIQPGNADTTCTTTDDYGKMRFNPATGRMYLCRL